MKTFAVTESGNPVETIMTSCMTIGADLCCDQPREAVLVATMMWASLRSVADKRSYPQTLQAGENHLAVSIDLASFAHYNPMYNYLKVSLVDAADPTCELADSLIIPPGSMSGEEAFEYDTVRFRFYAGQNTKVAKALMIIDCHGTGTNLFHDEIFRSFLDENGWSAIVFSDRGDLPETREMLSEFMTFADRADAAMDAAIAFFAKDRNHPELPNVPRATLGHSAATSGAIKYGTYHPDKVFACIGWRVHDKHPLAALSRNVPVLVMQGEIDGLKGGMMAVEGATPGYGNNADQLGLSINLVNDGYPLTYVLCPGANHGSGGAIGERCIIFRYLLRAYAARVPEDVDFTAAPATLRSIDYAAGYYGDLTNIYEYFVTDGEEKSYDYGKIGEYQNAGQKYSWLWDETFARQWKEFSETRDIKE